MELILLGYWSSESEQSLPNPVDMVAGRLTDEDRDDASDYLRRGFIVRAYMGQSSCRMCGASNGSLELSDGTYVWPEGLAHYVSEHNVRLPGSFLTHLRQRSLALEAAQINDTWWRSLSLR
jgi:hypothetical protein